MQLFTEDFPEFTLLYSNKMLQISVRLLRMRVGRWSSVFTQSYTCREAFVNFTPSNVFHSPF